MDIYFNANNLPDIVLLKILRYLPYWEICKSGEVSRRWYDISREVLKNLKRVDLSEKELLYHQFDKLIPQLPVGTKFLYIKALSCLTGKTLCITPSTLHHIGVQCPTLKILIFDGAFIARDTCMTLVNLDDIPKSVTSLSFRSCFFHADQFLYYLPEDEITKNHFRTNICRIDFGNCFRIEDNDVPFLTRLTHLNELHIDSCKYLTKIGIATLTSCFLGPNLIVLNIEENIHMLDFFKILCENCPNLEKLYVANTGMDENELFYLKEKPLLALRELCLRRLPFDDTALIFVGLYLKKLTWLNVSGTKVTQIGLNNLKTILPQCQAVYHSDRINPVHCDHFLTNSKV